MPPPSASRPYINIFNRERPIVAWVAGNFRITDVDSESDIHHVVLDFGERTFPALEGQFPECPVRQRNMYRTVCSVSRTHWQN